MDSSAPCVHSCLKRKHKSLLRTANPPTHTHSSQLPSVREAKNNTVSWLSAPCGTFCTCSGISFFLFPFFLFLFFFISIFLFFFAGLLKKWDIVRKTAWEHCSGCVWMHGHTRTNMKDCNVRQHRKWQVVRFLMNRQGRWWQHQQGAPTDPLLWRFSFLFCIAVLDSSEWTTWKEKLRRVFNR